MGGNLPRRTHRQERRKCDEYAIFHVRATSRSLLKTVQTHQRTNRWGWRDPQSMQKVCTQFISINQRMKAWQVRFCFQFWIDGSWGFFDWFLTCIMLHCWLFSIVTNGEQNNEFSVFLPKPNIVSFNDYRNVGFVTSQDQPYSAESKSILFKN